MFELQAFSSPGFGRNIRSIAVARQLGRVVGGLTGREVGIDEQGDVVVGTDRIEIALEFIFEYDQQGGIQVKFDFGGDNYINSTSELEFDFIGRTAFGDNEAKLLRTGTAI